MILIHFYFKVLTLVKHYPELMKILLTNRDFLSFLKVKAVSTSKIIIEYGMITINKFIYDDE